MTDHVILDASALSGWRKSSYSSSSNDSCVEVLDNHPSGVPVRDSKNPHGPALVIPTTSWTAFVTSIGSGAFGQ